ncbi:protein mono-ADP-ribosyltransferase PARP12-like [Tachysurus vachellii]|uniref:protein mono-ADP-ribosyltransferase PARP12-like n=1 Tax=Tachysurus vachellii TaxID=175792 RepID=UPI00296B1CC1|nr:protein mono-ADP-ribosyltransferase PARP12-like [Tachysurus vachellii]
MVAVVSNHVLKALCNNQCCLEFRQLDSILRQSFTVDERLFERALQDNERFRVVVEDSAELALSPGALIIATTSLRVCKDPVKCTRCEELHLCRYLVCGNCRFGNKCKNSHDMKSAHNTVLLKKKNVDFLEDTQLFQLLLQNDPSFVPEICSHYNKGNGEHGSCKYQASCTSLHICQHFLQDDCKYGAACKRAHNFDATAVKILNSRGFSAENIRTLQKTYKNKFLLINQTDKSVSKGAEKDTQVKRQHSSSSVSEADRNEICLFFVRKGCSFKEKCVRVHHDLPYKWEILDEVEVTWKQFPNEEDVERDYCNPANDTSFGPLTVDFTSMTYGKKKVRRLSTASSVTKPPHFILTTEWLWYWKNDEGQWIEYGQGEDKRFTSITSKALENVYLSKIETEIPFSVDGSDYVLSITGMYQQNKRYKTKRAVRRRPRFVSAQDVKGKSKSDAPETTSCSSVEVPDHWDKAALPSFFYTTVTLSGSEPDYKKVTDLFKRTMSSSIIHSIKRVQNPSLWKVFQWQKEQMKERNGGRAIEERQLFHGTDKSLIEAICEQNFDWRVCGVHGSLYGKGSYFARDAKYSDKYVKSKGATKMMFVALVLVGEFTKGCSSFLRPPQKTQKAGFYDSCVDNPSNPAIFVIFEKYQIYPEYIIEYS